METLWANLNSTILFIVTLSILIVVHEWGHFITAKRPGDRGGTLRAGVRTNDIFTDAQWDALHDQHHSLGWVCQDGRDERSQCSGKPDEFYSKPAGHRALVVFNGPVVNFIFAYVCLFIVFMAGYPDLSNKIGTILEGYPAQAAGLQVGDQILRVNDRTTESWSGLQEAITSSTADTIQLGSGATGVKSTQTIAPRVEMNKSIFGKYLKVRLVGIRPAEDIITLKYNPAVALLKSGARIGQDYDHDL